MDTYRVKRKLIIKIAHLLGKVFNIGLPPAPSVSAIIFRGKNVLVIKLTYRDGYALPGGGLLTGESFAEGLAREVWEETGLKIISLEYFNSYSYNIEYPSINVAFLVRVKGKLKASDEGQPMWVDSHKIVNDLYYQDNRAALTEWLTKKS